MSTCSSSACTMGCFALVASLLPTGGSVLISSKSSLALKHVQLVQWYSGTHTVFLPVILEFCIIYINISTHSAIFRYM